jgi:hypothetical protein
MDASGSPETLIPIGEITRRHIPENSSPNRYFVVRIYLSLYKDKFQFHLYEV